MTAKPDLGMYVWYMRPRGLLLRRRPGSNERFQALEQLSRTCAIISAPLRESFLNSRLSQDHSCPWDPCGHREQVRDQKCDNGNLPATMALHVTGDGGDAGVEYNGSDPAQHAPHTQQGNVMNACTASASTGPLGVATGAVVSDPRVQCSLPQAFLEAVAVWPRFQHMRGLRSVQLHVSQRMPTNSGRDLIFWRAIAVLPFLEELLVRGLPGAPGIVEFLEMLAGHPVLRVLHLEGQERDVRASERMCSALATLTALQEVHMSINLEDGDFVQEIISVNHNGKYQGQGQDALGSDDGNTHSQTLQAGTEMLLCELREAQNSLDTAWKGSVVELSLRHPRMENVTVFVYARHLRRKIEELAKRLRNA